MNMSFFQFMLVLVDQTWKRYSLSSDIPWLVGLSPDVSLKLFEFCGLAVIIHLPPYVGHNSFDHLLLACISIRDFHHPLHTLLLVLFSLQMQVAINQTGIAKGVGVLGIAPSSNRVKLLHAQTTSWAEMQVKSNTSFSLFHSKENVGAIHE